MKRSGSHLDRPPAKEQKLPTLFEKRRDAIEEGFLFPRVLATLIAQFDDRGPGEPLPEWLELEGVGFLVESWPTLERTTSAGDSWFRNVHVDGSAHLVLINSTRDMVHILRPDKVSIPSHSTWTSEPYILPRIGGFVDGITTWPWVIAAARLTDPEEPATHNFDDRMAIAVCSCPPSCPRLTCRKTRLDRQINDLATVAATRQLRE